jgi:polyisoprenoid-binding protein YceI
MNQSLLRKVLSVSVLALSVASSAMAADTYKVDPVHSSAEFRIKHMGVSTVAGRFNEIAGTVTLDAKDESKNAVQIEIQTKSVDTANEARDKHLRTADFFDVEKNPTMSFKSTSFKKKGASKYEVKGDFTLHGVTKPLTVEVEQVGTGKSKEGKDLAGFETSFTIKRSEFGMDKMLGTSLIGDDVKITVSVETGKQ